MNIQRNLIVFALLLCLGAILQHASWADEESLEERARTLIDASDCFTCHMVEMGIIGPSYLEVAKRYKDDTDAIDALVEKVIDGGSGNWGEVPMLAHSDLDEDEVREIVKWILSLNID